LISKDKKSKLYTYDYDGKLISVITLKGHKFPPTAATLGYLNFKLRDPSLKMAKLK